ncbi:HTH-type transcriptional regulator HdfR [Streptomyces tendae]
MAIIVPMVHQQSSRPRLSPSGDTEDIVALLAPRLAHFAGVARTEHVTRAAQEMNVPQSTLSRALVRLEQDLGVDLFVRRGRTLALTVAGRTFLGSVERALAEVERAADEVRADADPATGKVAFGFLHTMGAETVPGLLHAFRADHPRVRFSLVQNYGEAMLERLRAGELDLCLTSPVPDAPDLVARRLDEGFREGERRARENGHRTTDSSAAAAVVRSRDASGETCSRPPAIGSRTPSGASRTSAPPSEPAASRPPSARSARIPANGCRFGGSTQGTSSGRSAYQATNARCATRRTLPVARMRSAALPPRNP